MSQNGDGSYIDATSKILLDDDNPDAGVIDAKTVARVLDGKLADGGTQGLKTTRMPTVQGLMRCSKSTLQTTYEVET
ncbi:MAG: hypothetical protein GY822_21335 [Deltaproteobacteria bacterium]|nr:hypothetical protein [Deltaproteobacteria bacterium]